MAKPKKDLRSACLSIIARDVGELVKRDRFASLEYVLDQTGYVFSRNAGTSAELGQAIVALANIIPVEVVCATAEAVAFERAFGRTNRGAEEFSRRSTGARWGRASEIAEAASRGVDLAPTELARQPVRLRLRGVA